MNRRNVLLGLGTAAAGSGIVFGSGAFTQVQAERSVTIGVDEDSNALLALEAGDNVASVYNSDETGELVIDTEQLDDDNAAGFNVGSTVQIGRTENEFGDTVSDGSDFAFKLTNNFDNVPADDTDENGSLDIGINLDNLGDPNSTLEFIGTVYPDDGEESGTSKSISDGGRKVFKDVESGDVIYFAIRIETASTTDPEDFEGSVVFEAGPNLDGETPVESTQITGIQNITQSVEYDKIDTALDEANSDDLIQLSAGDYSSSSNSGRVVVETPGLTIQGPNVGTVGDASRDTEATLSDGVRIEADRVTLDGVEITSSSTNGVRFGPDVAPSYVSVKNSVIDVEGGSGGNRAAGNGVQFQFSSVLGKTVEDIRILQNKISVATGTADNESTATGVDVLPRGNDIKGIEIAGNIFTNINPGDASDGDEARGIIIDTQKDDSSDGGSASASSPGEVSEILISDNEFKNFTATDKVGIALFEDYRISTRVGPENFEIVQNTFNIGSSGGSIFVGGYENLGGAHQVTRNNFNSGGVIRFGADQDGFSQANADVLNATNNYWGASDGPGSIPSVDGTVHAVEELDGNNNESSRPGSGAFAVTINKSDVLDTDLIDFSPFAGSEF